MIRLQDVVHLSIRGGLLQLVLHDGPSHREGQSVRSWAGTIGEIHPAGLINGVRLPTAGRLRGRAGHSRPRGSAGNRQRVGLVFQNPTTRSWPRCRGGRRVRPRTWAPQPEIVAVSNRHCAHGLLEYRRHHARLSAEEAAPRHRRVRRPRPSLRRAGRGRPPCSTPPAARRLRLSRTLRRDGSAVIMATPTRRSPPPDRVVVLAEGPRPRGTTPREVSGRWIAWCAGPAPPGQRPAHCLHLRDPRVPSGLTDVTTRARAARVRGVVPA